MGLHTKSDFAKLCGLKTSHITTYVEREKLIMSGDYIDDSVSQNREFLEKRKITNGVITKNEGEESQNGLMVEKPVMPEPKVGMVAPPKAANGLTAVKIRKTNVEIDLLNIKKEKLNGQVVPTDLVKMVISQFSVNVATAYKNASDNLLIEIAKKKSLSSKDTADLRGTLTKNINAAINEAIDISKKGIVKIIEEYTERKDVGERE